MPLYTEGNRVGQATEPTNLYHDAALIEQAALRDERADSEAAKEKASFWSGLSLHAVLAICALLLSLPFVWMLCTSLKAQSEVGSPNWVPGYSSVELGADATPKQIAEQKQFNDKLVQPENYLNVFDFDSKFSLFGWEFDNSNRSLDEQGVPFHVFFRNSVFVACWVTFLQVFTSSLAAFSFARLQWPGRDKVFLLYLSTMMLPGLVMMIPNYQIMIGLGLVDTLPGLIIPAAFSAFGTFLLRQFMLTIPPSLDEAAMIDGASKWRVFWDIILPLARPGVVTLTIFTFMGNYNSFFWPLVMMRTEEKYTLPVGLLFFDSSRGSQTHLLMAAVTMSVIPMIIVFVLMQKQLVKGIQLGAVKG